MKKAQVCKFWGALENSTSQISVISQFKNQPGFDSKRTLTRYVQAAGGFQNGLSLEEISRITGWSANWLEALRGWWLEWQDKKEPSGAPSDETNPAVLEKWIRDNLREAAKAVHAYGEELRVQIQRAKIHRDHGGGLMPPKVPFGLAEKTIIESITGRDHRLISMEQSFSQAVNDVDLQRAERLRAELLDELNEWLHI